MGAQVSRVESFVENLVIDVAQLQSKAYYNAASNNNDALDNHA